MITLCLRNNWWSGIVVIFLISIALCSCQAQDFPILKGEYLGQETPDSIPRIFAPEIVSVSGRYEYGLAISPDGAEIFFTAGKPGKGLMVSRRLDGVWTEPELARLRNTDSKDIEAFYSIDGKTVFFASDMTGSFNTRIWFVKRDSTSWGKAQLLDSPINDADVMWATVTSEMTIYYTNVVEDKIYRSRPVDGKYAKIEDVGLPFGVHPFIAPDESFVLFNGKGDIYISYRKDDYTFTEPQILGGGVNTRVIETCPSLSPDGKYLFFARYDDLEGKSNIYWVNFEFATRSIQPKSSDLDMLAE